MRTDPRIRQSLNRISISLESASDNALTSCFTFTKSYLDPCLISLSACCTLHHDRNHHRDRSEYPFGFYDYDDDEHGGSPRGGFLAWGNDELDRLLAGGGSGGGYGGSANRMYYGASSSSGAIAGGAGSGPVGKRKSVPSHDQDPTVIPQTSMFGFLARWAPFRGKGLRYKPSAANLQEHPQRGTDLSVVHEEETEDEQGTRAPGARRKRSATNSSGDSVGGSMRSRGDLWPSEDDDDAIPIGDDVFLRGSDGEDDGFLALTRRERNRADDEGSDGTIGPARHGPVDDEVLRREEEEAKILEEAEVERKRKAARRLAVQRGLSTDDYTNSRPPIHQEINPSTVPLPETLPSTRASSMVEQQTYFEPPLPPAPMSVQQAYSELPQSLPHERASTPVTRISTPTPIRTSTTSSVRSQTPTQIRKEKELPEIPTMIILLPSSERELVKEINEAANSGVVSETRDV